MCGRATLTVDVDELADVFALDELPAIVPRFNIAPTQPLPIIREPGSLEFAPWGTKERRVINVRLERATTKPGARCLVVVDGFYEWATLKDKQPFYFHRTDKKPFALGGVVLGEGAAIVTTTPIQGIADIHDRMPLILAQNDWEPWLGGDKPTPSFDGFERYAVSKFVNTAKNEGPKCVEAAGPMEKL